METQQTSFLRCTVFDWTSLLHLTNLRQASPCNSHTFISYLHYQIIIQVRSSQVINQSLRGLSQYIWRCRAFTWLQRDDAAIAILEQLNFLFQSFHSAQFSLARQKNLNHKQINFRASGHSEVLNTGVETPGYDELHPH